MTKKKEIDLKKQEENWSNTIETKRIEKKNKIKNDYLKFFIIL